MKRTKEGLIFDNPQEEREYNRKKEEFLRRTDEQNAAQYLSELKRKYGGLFDETT